MFECRACLSRSLRAIAGDALTANAVRRPLVLTPRLATPPIRRAASSAAAVNPFNDDVTTPSLSRDAFDTAIAPDGAPALKKPDTKALRTELQYLSDPLKLAEHVRYTLRCNKPDKALDLCRLASKERDVIVSWNHCVDWHMAHGRTDDAIKIYNEMKKRAQFPDSYTYVLLLRGLAKPHHHGAPVKQANVARALSIYNSMKAPNSRVKPSIFHTNATLRVCSAALDMDALWSVAAKLPSKGFGAPDYMTYSILLNAIRHGATGDNPVGQHLDQISARRQEAVNQGRRIWQEVVAKWRAGEVNIDEELVCSMGRLLLVSKRLRDWDDVLSLVHQTMNIERQIAPIGSPERNVEHVPQEIQAPRVGEIEESPEDEEGYRDAPSTKAFHPVKPMPPDPAQPKRPTSLAYVTPGNPTLSMLIGTCTTLRTPKTANAYWALMTSDEGRFQLKPDLANYHAFIRLLGSNRASAKVAEVLKILPPDIEPKNATFRIAMSACVRDKKSPHALTHARTVVDIMEKHVADPDVHTLTQYLELALQTEDGPRIVAALDRLDPIVHNLRSRISYGADSPKSEVADVRERREILGFLQAVVGVIDTLMHRGFVPREDFGHWHGRRGQLTQYIGRARGRLDRQVEGLDAAKKEGVERAGKARGGGNGLRMSNAEFALRQLRWRERRVRKREEGRARAKGLQEWDIGQMGRRRGFADSPMELAVDGGARRRG